MSFLGELALKCFYGPLHRWRDSRRAGGPEEEKRTEAGRREMEAAAWTLPELPSTSGVPLHFHLLTGKRFWYQTAFCLWSLARHTQRPLAPMIYDDGTLEKPYREALQRLFPAMRFVDQRDTVDRLDAHLPAKRYPVLRERWTNYPNIRKLTDVHVGSLGWKLVLDSDLLFFAPPELLVRWLDAPEQPLHAVDYETSYGYSRPLMNELAGHPVADLVNVGLTGLRSDALDWDQLEQWCATLIAREKTSYYLEQALIAMLVAGRPCTIAPATEYVTLPLPPEADRCRAVMHHYVAHSKRWYFQQNWRRVLTAKSA